MAGSETCLLTPCTDRLWNTNFGAVGTGLYRPRVKPLECEV